MTRSKGELEETIEEVRSLRSEFWQNLRVPGEANTLNQNLEFAGRVADFMELGEVMARDALTREESCGCHFRTAYQTAEGEAAAETISLRLLPPGNIKATNSPLRSLRNFSNLRM